MRKSNKKYQMKRQPDLRLGKASTEEIVKRTVERLDPDGDWNEVYDAVYSALQTDQFRMLRSGDTLVFYHVNTPIADEAHLFTIEKQEDLMESLRDLGQAFKNDQAPRRCKIKAIPRSHKTVDSGRGSFDWER